MDAQGPYEVKLEVENFDIDLKEVLQIELGEGEMEQPGLVLEYMVEPKHPDVGWVHTALAGQGKQMLAQLVVLGRNLQWIDAARPRGAEAK